MRFCHGRALAILDIRGAYKPSRPPALLNTAATESVLVGLKPQGGVFFFFFLLDWVLVGLSYEEALSFAE